MGTKYKLRNTEDHFIYVQMGDIINMNILWIDGYIWIDRYWFTNIWYVSWSKSIMSWVKKGKWKIISESDLNWWLVGVFRGKKIKVDVCAWQPTRAQRIKYKYKQIIVKYEKQKKEMQGMKWCKLYLLFSISICHKKMFEYFHFQDMLIVRVMVKKILR